MQNADRRAQANTRRIAAATVSRAVTAAVGGYASAAGVVSLAARTLPIATAEATAWAIIASFLVYAAVGLWCLHEPRLGRAVALVWGSAAVCAAALLLLGPRQ